MKKAEITEIMMHLWGNVDQAPFDTELEKLMKTAPIAAQKAFIESIIESPALNEGQDEEILNKAKRLVGYYD